MHIESAGREGAQRLLFIHGGGVAGWMWRAQVEHFAPTHRVWVPDLPGHGRSADEPFTGHADVVDQLARHLPVSWDGADLTVVGFSLGAQIALELASTRPDLVSGVVVVSALAESAPLSGMSASLIGAAAPLAKQRWFGKLQAKALFIPDALMEDYLRDSATVSRENLVAVTRINAAFRIPEAWPRFPGRALLLAGSKEPRALLKGMQALQSARPGSELEIVEGAGHGLPLQRAAWFNERLAAWLAGGPTP